MTEKHYGGSSGFGFKDKQMKKEKEKTIISNNSKSQNKKSQDQNTMKKEEIETLEKAGSIISKVKEDAKKWIKKDMPLLEIAEKIEAEIEKLGAKPAFPVNLSINQIAAHATPSFNDTEKAHGLLKVDLGCHIDGFISDTAFSLDLENSDLNKKLIKSAEDALKKALDITKLGTKINEIGKEIDSEISKQGFISVRNLSGHSIDQYDVHSGITIPNYDNLQEIELEEGLYAIEPFSTNGSGSVRDGKPSGIYQLNNPLPTRDPTTRKVLQFIAEEYQTLPFSSRWIYKKFGARGLFSLKQLEQQGILYQYPQLIEKSDGIVAQAEHSIIIQKVKTIITTE